VNQPKANPQKSNIACQVELELDELMKNGINASTAGAKNSGGSDKEANAPNSPITPICVNIPRWCSHFDSCVILGSALFTLSHF